jgi:uncharacterized protein (TIGR02147 family)
MNSIIEYIDYRLFLKEYYLFQKRSFKYFSYRYFAKKAGIKSPTFYIEVVEGKKNLSRGMIGRFCKAIKFTPKEAAYFKSLVLFNQAKTAEEKQEHYLVMRSMENAKSEKVLDPDQYDYFAQWHTVVIRELVTMFDFKDKWEALALSVYPAISAPEAKSSVELLMRLGLIEKSPKGNYIQKDTALTTQSGIGSLAVREFNRSMIARALAALDEIPKQKRNIFGVTVGISPAMFDLVCAEMQAFKDRIVTMASRDRQSDRVYQMNLQFYPVSCEVALKDQRGKPRQ